MTMAEFAGQSTLLERLGIKSKPIESWNDFLDPTNLMAIKLFGEKIDHLIENIIKTDPSLSYVLIDAATGKHLSVSEQLDGLAHTPQINVIKAISSLAYVGGRMQEEGIHSGNLQETRFPLDIGDHLSRAAYLLAPLIQDEYESRLPALVAKDLETAPPETAPSDPWETLVKSILSIGETHPDVSIVSFIRDLRKSPEGITPEAVRKTFEDLEPHHQQDLLQAIYDDHRTITKGTGTSGSLGVLLAQASIPREQRKLTRNIGITRPVDQAASHIQAITNMGETLVAVETAKGTFFGLISPPLRPDMKSTLHIFNNPGNPLASESLPLSETEAKYKII